jgi:hypothetical protein
MGQQAGVAPGKGIDTNYSCSDATALQYLNMVRQRVGVPVVTSFTYKQLLRERRLEFALEQDYWFDLGRIDGYNVTSHPVARNIIANQERGTYSTTTPPTIYSVHYTLNDSQFVFSVPSVEAAADPYLTKAPVPYVFK